METAIKHTQGTALKGRKFDSIEEQNAWLAHWEERWAAPRIHGRKKRQVLAMFLEEKPHLRPLPSRASASSAGDPHTVDDAGLVQVEGSYYAALPRRHRANVTVRIYEREIEILDEQGQMLRRHPSSTKGPLRDAKEDRIFNPSRETARLSARWPRSVPLPRARPRDLRALRPARAEGDLRPVELTAPLCEARTSSGRAERVLTLSQPSYHALKRILERTAVETERRCRRARAADRPARTSAASRNTTPSSKALNTASTIRRAIPRKP